MKAPRVVLDTNCLVSALLFNGRLAALRRSWQRGDFIPLLCRESVDELIRVLAYPKFKLSRREIDLLLAEILPFAEVCRVAEPDQALPGLADAADAVFVHLARQNGAEVLVSGDAHLLGLAEPGVSILSPAHFLSRFGLND